MKDPFEVAFDVDPDHASPIEPGFPQWQKSFVSGPDSHLFRIGHFLSIEDPMVLVSRTRFLGAAEGPPGHVHGGASAGLLDEVMGILVWHHGFPGVTRSIQVHYRKALPLQTEALVLTRLLEVKEKILEVHSTIYDPSRTAFVSARGIFHRLTGDQLERFRK